MSLKKAFFLLLAILGCFSLWAQEAKDVVLLVDTSAGMFPCYNEVNNYLTGPFLSENLNFGDTLHIISFASKPRFEIARRLLGKDDIETVSGRIWLLYPLESTGSAESSLNYAEQYVRSIPGGRAKKVFVVSNNESVGTLTNSVAGRLKPNGIDVFFIRASERMGAGTPGSNNAGSRTEEPPRITQSPGGNTAGAAGNNTGSTTAAGTTTTGTAAAGTTPSGTNAAGNNAGTGATAAGNTTAGTGNTTTGTAGNNTAGVSNTTDNGSVTGTGSNISEQTTENIEENEETGGLGESASGAENNGAENGGAVYSGELTQNGDESNNNGLPTAPKTESSDTTAFSALPLPLPLLLGLFLLLLLLVIIIIAIRKRGSSSGKTISDGGTTARNAEFLNSFASRQTESSLQGGGPRRSHSQYKDPGRFPTDPPMLNLFVEEQNTAIGRRNIHTLKKGSTYSIGGGASDFLIFLVPVPYKVAELYFDGNNCTFTPLKPQYFPDLGSKPVSECIGKTIRLLSDKKYEVFFHFERYRDPLIALNQLLHSIQSSAEKDHS